MLDDVFIFDQWQFIDAEIHFITQPPQPFMIFPAHPHKQGSGIYAFRTNCKMDGECLLPIKNESKARTPRTDILILERQIKDFGCILIGCFPVVSSVMNRDLWPPFDEMKGMDSLQMREIKCIFYEEDGVAPCEGSLIFENALFSFRIKFPRCWGTWCIYSSIPMLQPNDAVLFPDVCVP